jgi:N12 class adenine-specific DNA methylase
VAPEARNFVIAQDAEPQPSERGKRLRANLDAIVLLKRLEAEDRLPTPEEKAVLARYNGFGADKEVFNDTKAGYRQHANRHLYPWYAGGAEYTDPETGETTRQPGWETEYGRWYDAFLEVMTPEERQAASRSTLNAHYTPAWMCRAVWDLALRTGFQGGEVFEPGCGVGNFMGTAPEAVRDRTRLSGVELDWLTARLAAKLYPQSRIEHASIEDASAVADNSQDLAVGNVPFSDVAPPGQRGSVKLNLHNYCISKSIDKLRPGGIAILITSHRTLDGPDAQRAVLADKAELVAAVRLPNDAFLKNANTRVVTDILVLRKPLGLDRGPETWRRVEPIEVAEAEANGEGNRVTSVNEYFYRHPERVLGTPSLQGGMYGAQDQFTVKNASEAATAAERLAGLRVRVTDALTQVPANLLSPRLDSGTPLRETPSLRADTDLDVGSFVDQAVEGPGGALPRSIYVVAARDEGSQEKVYAPPPWRVEGAAEPRGLSAGDLDQMAGDFVRLREGLRDLIRHDLSEGGDEEGSAAKRAALRAQYHAFVLRHGPLNACAPLKRYFRDDPGFGPLMALEDTRVVRHADGSRHLVCTPTEVLSRRTLYPVGAPAAAQSLEDAVYVSLAFRGRIDPGYVESLLGPQGEGSAEGIKRRIVATGLAFENPETGLLEIREQYLSGNVFAKLEAAEARLQSNPEYEANAAALRAVLPEPVPFERITAACGAPWVGNGLTRAFLHDVTGQGQASRILEEVMYVPSLREWMMPAGHRWSVRYDCQNTYGTDRVHALDVIEAALNDRRITVKDKVDEHHVVNQPATEAANHRVELVKEKWADWVGETEERRKQVEERYNDAFNRVVTPVYRGDHLRFPGLANGAGAMVPRPHQRAAVARFLAEQSGVVAHNVGFGKTLTSILVAMESKRVGIARKPMIVCYNANYADFAATLRRCYPAAKVLVTEDHHLQEKHRHTFLSRVATGDWDAVLIAQSQFDRIPVSPETEAKFLDGQVRDLREGVEAMEHTRFEKATVRKLERQLLKGEAKLKDALLRARENLDKSTMHFDDLGVDLLIVDEAHEYKNVPLNTRYRNVKGLSQTPSHRARMMLMKADLIQSRRGGKGILFLTGTPIKNQVVEAYNMLRLTAPRTLQDFSVPHVDDFIRAFCKREAGLELNEANGKWREVERLKKYHNGTELVRLIRTAFDVEMDASKVQLNVPQVRGDRPQLVKVPLSDPVADILERLSDCYAEYEKAAHKRELSWVPITLMQFGVAASVDPRLVDPQAPDDPQALVNQLVRNAKAIYDRTAREGSVQTIFCDRYRTMDGSILRTLVQDGLEAARASLEIEDADALGGREREGGDDAPDEDAEPARAVGKFNLYHDVRDKLIALGVPRREIALINEAKTPVDRQRMFDAANEGKVRFVIGSRMKQGVGANYQRKLLVAHHLDPARDLTPASMTQANGRIVRQGNENPVVEINYYGMQDTMTPGIFHRLQTKQHFIAQVLSGVGVGPEFDEAGSLDLEEMRNGLISDKRALVHTDLKLALREKKMRNKVLFDRKAQVESAIRGLKGRLEKSNQDWAAEQAVAEWCQANMKVIDAFDDEMAIAYAYPALEPDKPGESGEKSLKAIKVDLRKILWEHWNRAEIPGRRDYLELGTLVLNGLPMRIRKERPGLELALMDRKPRLTATVHHPVTGKPLGKVATFATYQALINLARARYDLLVRAPAERQRELEAGRGELARLEQERDRLEMPDLEGVKELEAKLVALEVDMREHPYQRRGRRGEAAPSVEIEVQGVTVRQDGGVGRGQVSPVGCKTPEEDDEGITVRVTPGVVS